MEVNKLGLGHAISLDACRVGAQADEIYVGVNKQIQTGGTCIIYGIYTLCCNPAWCSKHCL